MSEGDDRSRRAAGRARMEEVYGFSIDPDELANPFHAFTVDHLFGNVWSRPGLDVRDRRLLTIGVLAAMGRDDLLEVQFESALRRGELTAESLFEVTIHVAHYVGWGPGAAASVVAERVIDRLGLGKPEAGRHGRGGPGGDR
ncbi:MAG TPA: carboxymuconolactone decarboxylase family protein [Acidimicrobiales bacterium]|nr:carboxymuconolactone decarboxylase family protein [Acidimicrobiales bacterium]